MCSKFPVIVVLLYGETHQEQRIISNRNTLFDDYCYKISNFILLTLYIFPLGANTATNLRIECVSRNTCRLDNRTYTFTLCYIHHESTATRSVSASSTTTMQSVEVVANTTVRRVSKSTCMDGCHYKKNHFVEHIYRENILTFAP